MMPVAPFATSLEVQLVIVLVGIVLARVFHRRLFGTRAGKALAVLAVLTVLLSHAAWAVGPAHYPTSYWGVQVAMTMLPLATLFVASLIPAAALRALAGRLLPPPALGPASSARDGEAAAMTGEAPARTSDAPETTGEAPAKRAAVSRRQVLAATTSLAPALALGVGVAGFRNGVVAPELRHVPMAFSALPRELSGLRIVQLSDLHLGCGRGVDDVERALDRIGRVDLIAFTGDVVEEVALLGPVLRAAIADRPRLGVVACLGNHEYLRGIHETRPLYERSGVDLVVDDARTFAVGRSKLTILGVDDPISIHAPIDAFLEERLERALARAGAADFRVLLAHRPEAFPAAAIHGVDLTLSGHTHGGQIGFNGKSAFQPIWPDRYLWGEASRGQSRLYTTSGFGHWYPFRLGCPSEAPILELASVDAADAAANWPVGELERARALAATGDGWLTD